MFNSFSRYFYIIVWIWLYDERNCLLSWGNVCRSRLYNFCCVGSWNGVGNKLLLPSANLVPNGDRCGSMPMIVALVGTLRKCSNFSWKGRVAASYREILPRLFFTFHVERDGNWRKAQKYVLSLKIIAFSGINYFATFNGDDRRNETALFSGRYFSFRRWLKDTKSLGVTACAKNNIAISMWILLNVTIHYFTLRLTRWHLLHCPRYSDILVSPTWYSW